MTQAPAASVLALAGGLPDVGTASASPMARGGGSALELTILMPCLNEAQTVGTCVAKAHEFLARSGVAGEIVVARIA